MSALDRPSSHVLWTMKSILANVLGLSINGATYPSQQRIIRFLGNFGSADSGAVVPFAFSKIDSHASEATVVVVAVVAVVAVEKALLVLLVKEAVSSQ